MSFGDHLEDLRRRILWGVAVPLPLAIVAFIFSDPLVKWLYLPLDGVLEGAGLPRGMQVLGPAETLVIKIKLSLIFAVVLSTPWLLWQAWLFVRPGLYRHERRFVHLLLPGSAVLTVAGIALMYFAMLPLMLRILVMFGASLELAPSQAAEDPRVTAILAADPDIRLRREPSAQPQAGDVWIEWPRMVMLVAVEEVLEEGETRAPAIETIQVPPPAESFIKQEFRLTTYINFVLILLLGIVIAFQMPLVILLMGWLGIVSATMLRAKRKYAMFICAAVAAVITPADAMSMVIMFVPLYGLFELSIVLLILAPASAVAEGSLWDRLRRRKRPQG